MVLLILIGNTYYSFFWEISHLALDQFPTNSFFRVSTGLIKTLMIVILILQENKSSPSRCAVRMRIFIGAFSAKFSMPEDAAMMKNKKPYNLKLDKL